MPFTFQELSERIGQQTQQVRQRIAELEGNPETQKQLLELHKRFELQSLVNTVSQIAEQTSAILSGLRSSPTNSPPSVDQQVALFNQHMAAGFTEQHGGAITTNALSHIATDQQQFLASPHH
jgi:hypothetical protein